MAISATYALYVDWNGDGDFGDAGEDITADWISATIERGFDSPLARVAKVTRAVFVVDNQARAYSPALVANALPRRQVRFDMSYSSTTVTLFRGFVEEIVPDHGARLQRKARLVCVDAMALLDVANVSIALQLGARAHTIISSIVSAVYTPPATDYDNGVTVFPISADRWSFAEWSGFEQAIRQEQISAAQKIKDVCASDWGRFYVNKAGAPAYANRHNQALNSTTALTLSDNMRSLQYKKGIGPVYNSVKVTCHPRMVGTTVEVLAKMDEQTPPRIEAGTARTFSLRYRDPANGSKSIGATGVITPLAGTDFVCTSDEAGEGTDLSATVTIALTAYADKAEVEVTATTNAVYVQSLQTRGYAVRVLQPVTMRKTDSSSVSSYQTRELTLDAVLMTSEADAYRLAEYLLNAYKTPGDVVRGVEVIGNKSATFLAAVRDLELLDRVVVTETQAGLSGYAGYIFGMTHSIPNKWDHRITLDIETAPSLGGTAFRLDTSALNSGHVLIF